MSRTRTRSAPLAWLTLLMGFGIVGFPWSRPLGAEASGPEGRLVSPGRSVSSQRASLAAQLDMEHFEFVGVTESGSPAERIGPLGREILVVCARPCSLDDIVSAGIPFRMSEFRRLADWGYMEQVGTELHSSIPILRRDKLREYEQSLAELLPAFVDAVEPAFRDLAWTLQDTGYADALPAVASWVLTRRAWDVFQREGIIDLDGTVRGQREAFPDRGWYGFLWYREDPPTLPVGVDSFDYEEYSLLACWPNGRRPGFLAGEDAPRRWRRFLDKLEDRGREVDDPDDFEDLAPSGLFDAAGNVSLPAVEWTPDLEGTPGWSTERTAMAVARALENQLNPLRMGTEIRPLEKDFAFTVVYMDLIPAILRELQERGIPVLDIEPEATTFIPTVTEDEAESDEERRRSPWVIPVNREEMSPGAVLLHGFSAMIWRDLPRSGIVRYLED